MPYRKRRGTKGWYNPVPRMKRIRRKKTLSKKVAILSKKVKSAEDRRWRDATHTSIAIPVAGIVMDAFGFSLIDAGPLEDQRQGNDIAVQSLEIRGQLFNSATDAYNKVRLMVVWVEEYRGLMPVMSDFLQGDALPVVGDPSHLSPWKKNSNFKFHKIWEKSFSTQKAPPNAGNTYHDNICFRMYKKFKKPHKVSYENNAALPPTKSFFLFAAISDSGSVPHPVVAMTSRITYLG